MTVDVKQDELIVLYGLDAATLPKAVASYKVRRDQIVAITEPEPGKYSLIFESTPDQLKQYDEILARQGAARRKPLPYTMGSSR